jgi:hypothetical protein
VSSMLVHVSIPDEQWMIQSIRRNNDALVARDWDAFAAGFAEAFRYEDRRSGLQSSGGKAENITQMRVVAELGLQNVDIDALETRGARFLLARLTFHVSDFTTHLLIVVEFDAKGRLLAGILFDDDDLNAASTELEGLAVDAG